MRKLVTLCKYYKNAVTHKVQGVKGVPSVHGRWLNFYLVIWQKEVDGSVGTYQLYYPTPD